MGFEKIKFKVSIIEIIIVIVAIIVISFVSIMIKNYIKDKQLIEQNLAENNVIEEGDSVISIANEENVGANLPNSGNAENSSPNNVNKEEQTTSSNKTKIVIKNGSTAVVEIPVIGVLAQVTEGTDSDILKNYVGVVEGSARPGQTVNYSIAAHNNIDTEIFRNLHKLNEGDIVNIYTQSKKYTYKVTEKFTVKPTQIEVLQQPKDKKEITLITCNYNATARIIVKGILQSEERVRLSKN